jgi:hypothetical protein
MSFDMYPDKERREIRKLISGKKVKRVDFCHDYFIVILDDGTEIEASGVTSSKEAKEIG